MSANNPDDGDDGPDDGAPDLSGVPDDQREDIRDAIRRGSGAGVGAEAGSDAGADPGDGAGATEGDSGAGQATAAATGDATRDDALRMGDGVAGGAGGAQAGQQPAVDGAGVPDDAVRAGDGTPDGPGRPVEGDAPSTPTPGGGGPADEEQFSRFPDRVQDDIQGARDQPRPSAGPTERPSPDPASTVPPESAATTDRTPGRDPPTPESDGEGTTPVPAPLPPAPPGEPGPRSGAPETVRSDIISQFEDQTGREISPEQVFFEETDEGFVGRLSPRLRREIAEENIEEELEAEFGMDLEPGEDFIVTTTEDGFQGVLTDEFRREQATESIEQQFEDQLGMGLEPGEDFAVQETDEGFRGVLTEGFAFGQAAAEVEQQLEAQTGEDLEFGEDFTLVPSGDGFRAVLAEGEPVEIGAGAEFEFGETRTPAELGFVDELRDEPTGTEDVTPMAELFGELETETDAETEQPAATIATETGVRTQAEFIDEPTQTGVGEAPDVDIVGAATGVTARDRDAVIPGASPDEPVFEDVDESDAQPAGAGSVFFSDVDGGLTVEDVDEAAVDTAGFSGEGSLFEQAEDAVGAFTRPYRLTGDALIEGGVETTEESAVLLDRTLVEPAGEFGGVIGREAAQAAVLLRASDPFTEQPSQEELEAAGAAGERIGTGVGLGAAGLANVPRTAIGLSEAAGFAGEFGHATFIRGEGGELVTIDEAGNVDVFEGGFAEERIEPAVEQRIRAAQENPLLFSGTLGGSLIASVGLISGASRLAGAGTGRLVSTAIQPGEEAAIAAARRGIVSDRTAGLVPGVRTEENFRDLVRGRSPDFSPVTERVRAGSERISAVRSESGRPSTVLDDVESPEFMTQAEAARVETTDLVRQGARRARDAPRQAADLPTRIAEFTGRVREEAAIEARSLGPTIEANLFALRQRMESPFRDEPTSFRQAGVRGELDEGDINMVETDDIDVRARDDDADAGATDGPLRLEIEREQGEGQVMIEEILARPRSERGPLSRELMGAESDVRGIRRSLFGAESAVTAGTEPRAADGIFQPDITPVIGPTETGTEGVPSMLEPDETQPELTPEETDTPRFGQPEITVPRIEPTNVEMVKEPTEARQESRLRQEPGQEPRQEPRLEARSEVRQEPRVEALFEARQETRFEPFGDRGTETGDFVGGDISGFRERQFLFEGPTAGELAFGISLGDGAGDAPDPGRITRGGALFEFEDDDRKKRKRGRGRDGMFSRFDIL